MPVQSSARFLVAFLSATRRLGVLSLILIGSPALYGQDIWQGETSSWFTATNWSFGARPTSNQDAVVNNGTTAQIPVPPLGTPPATAATLTIGTTMAGSTVQLAGGDLGSQSAPVSVIIGPQGTLEFSGGFLTGSIQDNGTILFDTVPNQVLSGASGSGLITINGIALTLNGNNTFNGTTTISGNGSLQIGTGGIVGSIGGNIANSGILTFDRSDSFTFSGLISGPGSVQQNGLGTTVLTGNNTYTGVTTINAGTLQLGNGGTSGSITGNVIDNGLLAFNRSDVFAFGGVISGPGSVQQNGLGTTVLTGNSTYTGVTTINAGTLQLGNGGTTGNITGSVADNGILAFNRSNVLSFGGAISGAGSVQQIGTGTTVLTGNNTYSGGTMISAGTLQLGNGGTTGSVVGNVIDNGILAFNRIDVVTFGGAIKGTGSVTQIGTGATILTGNNSYTGITTISAGTLKAGSTTGLSANSAFMVNSTLDINGLNNTIGSLSGTGTVLNNGSATARLTVGNDNSNSTFNGILENGASALQLTKSGTGVLTLTGANTYTGTTTVSGGSLLVDGSIASSQTLVNAGGFLGGHGTIGGNVVNSGIVGQFNSPGTLTITGNYTQNPSGTLQIQIAGLGAGQHDLLAVNGHANLTGSLRLARLGGFNLSPGDQIVFLTANNGVSGNFSNVQNGFGTIVQGEVVALPNGVVLEAKQGSFETTPGVATTPNTLAVAKALDSAAGDPRAAALFAFLNKEPLANLPHDLTLIAPTQISSINATSVSLGKVQVSNVGQRLANIRGGSTGFSSSGFGISGAASNFGDGFAGVSGPEGKSGPSVLAPVPENRWGVFLTGLGEFTNVDSTSNAAGYDVDTGGFTLGVDYRLTPNFAIGFFGGYAHTNVDLVGGGNIDVNGGKIGLYATVFRDGFYLDTAVNGGPSGYNTRRTALQGTASGSTDGADLNVLVAAGYDWKSGSLSIGPTANFQFSYVDLNGFTESGSLAPLKFPDQNSESERTAFGAKASYDWKIGHITLIPQISAAWQHEYGTTAYSVVANFANGAGNSFTVNGPQIGRDSLLIGAGVSVLWNDRISTYVYYDGELGRTNYESHDISGGVRVTF
jgi:autotransporter-associated beta strand protein